MENTYPVEGKKEIYVVGGATINAKHLFLFEFKIEVLLTKKKYIQTCSPILL